MPGKGARSGADLRRAAAVLLLIAVAAVGLRAGGAFSSAGSPQILGLSGRLAYWAISVGEAVLAVAGIALLIARIIWARRSGAPLRQRRRSIWWLLLLPFAPFLLSKILAKFRKQHLAAPAAAGHQGAAHAAAAGHLRAGSPWLLLALFAVAAVAAGALTVYRRRREITPAPEPGAAPGPAPLTAALAAGAQALHANSDPRTAIIGCYAAMERSLADAGSPPQLADTPAEVLYRATTGGLVRSAWAATLTGLFRQARYSSHPMTEADRAAAIGALARVQADLGGRA